MNIELQKYINVVKEECRNLSLIEICDLMAPIALRMAELTDDARRSEKVIGWDLDMRKKELKKASDDLNEIIQAKAKMQDNLDALRDSIMEEKKKNNEEISLEKALLKKKEHEINAKIEEFEKMQYQAKYKEVAA